MINDLNNGLTDPSSEKMIDVNELSIRRRNSRLLLQDTGHALPDDSVINYAQEKVLPLTDVSGPLLNKDTDHSNNPGPIIDYAQEPILPLIDACLPLVDIVHDIIAYAEIALQSTSNEPADGLTRDESASIRLYTMEWKNTRESLYSNLNHTLKRSDREDLRPWFKYLKLFLTALVKIPCIRPQTVWRGIKKDNSAEFPKGAQVIWWGCSSTTTLLNVLESDLYLGTTGERTLFSIEVLNGRSVSAHSNYNKEEEILLLPGTYMEVQSQFHPAPGLHIIHLKQMVPNEMLLEPPFEGACLYPIPHRSWYTKKRHFIPIITLTVMCILAAVLGCVLAYKYGVKKRDTFVNWNGNNWAYMCDFNDKTFLNVTTPPERCGGKCLETNGCTHFTWVVTNGGTCFLKKGNVSKDDAFVTNDPTMVCGVVYHSQYQTKNSLPVSWNGHNWATSCDFIGNDLSSIAVSPQLCGAKCVETKECTHYAWNRWTGGTCFLKKDKVSKTDALLTNDPTMVCGIINGSQYEGPNSNVLWNGNNWAMSCDFINHDLSHVRTTAELCGSTCVQTPKCTHFSWSLFDGGTCWMKYGNISKNDAFSINDQTMVCGVVHST